MNQTLNKSPNHISTTSPTSSSSTINNNNNINNINNNNNDDNTNNINDNNTTSTTIETNINREEEEEEKLKKLILEEEKLKKLILEEECKIKELEKQLYSEKQAMSMIFKASGSSFGFKRRQDDETNNPNVPQLTPEESLKARVLAYKLASLALVYGTLLNVGAAVIFILICYFVFDIKTILDLKNVIRKFIRGQDYKNPDENLTAEERVEKVTQLFKSTLKNQENQ